MLSATTPRLRMLAILLAVDALLLLALGAIFMAIPSKVGLIFGFRDLPPAALYLFALWGCALISLGVGYAYAVGDPARHVTWVRAGIVRGILEAALGFIGVSNHMVTWHQAAPTTVVAGIIAIAYLILYPTAQS